MPNPEFVILGSRIICRIYIESYIRSIQQHASGILLDCGCGHVPYYEIYKDKVVDTICIDWPNSLHRNELLDHYVNLNERLPFDDKSFDTILLTDVLEHIQNPGLLMSELSRLLKPGAKLLVMVPFFYRLHEVPHDYYRYTEFALKGFCESNNLSVVELEPYGGFYDIIFDLLNKKFVKNRFQLKLLEFFYSLISSTKFYKSSKTNQSRKYPLGYCLVAKKNL
ncbi:class I SAM-dependent methyltransferase [bacterium]|nr:class I SAM-dependent methyltransferase [bacterium]